MKKYQLEPLIKRLSWLLGGLCCLGWVSYQAIADANSDSVQDRLEELQDIMRGAMASGISNTDQERLAALNNVNNNNANNSSNASNANSNASADSSKVDPLFAQTVQQLIPMSPKQIHKLKEIYSETQAAAALAPSASAKPTASALAVDLSPNATPPVIRLGAGYITSLVFLDASGQPWPIAAYSLGDPNSFNVQWDRKGNTLLIQSSTFFRNSNLAVMLRDLNTPVMVTLMSGQNVVDYRVDLRVPGAGPNAVFLRNSATGNSDPTLLDLLNGVPPSNAKELKVNGVNRSEFRAWVLNKQLYIRTTLHIISPGWQSVMGSVDGTRAYCMQFAPVLLVTRSGSDQLINLNLENLEP